MAGNQDEFVSYSSSATTSDQFARLDGVRTRRMMAFAIDYLIIAALVAIACIVIFFFGIITFGAAWLLYAIVGPLVALGYIALTMGGPKQATLGMQFFSIRLERLDGGRVDPTLAALHSILFWVLHIILTPLLLAASLFSSKKRLLQDVLLGTAVFRSDI